MGMYTELHFNSQLKREVPQNVIEILKYMLNNRGEESPPLPEHSFFKTDRWMWMLNSELRFDVITESYYLCIRCNVKNYTDEIEQFINWIHPYLDKVDGDFLGFYRYEESEQLTLIYYRDNYDVN